MINNQAHEFCIAVTGHRFINETQSLTISIRDVICRVIGEQPGADILLYSALAEGSDQLAASISREYGEVELVAVLPMPVDQYLQDIESGDAITKFTDLLNISLRVITLPEQSTRHAAYHSLGRYLVDTCDVLIALWNGQYSLKSGGTGEVVKYATQCRKPVYWIYCENNEAGVENLLRGSKNTGDIQLI